MRESKHTFDDEPLLKTDEEPHMKTDKYEIFNYECDTSSMQMFEPAIIHSTQRPLNKLMDSHCKQPEMFQSIEPIANWAL